MSKIAFIYIDHDGGNETRVEVTCLSDYLDSAVEKFKDFLRHVGHHPSNVERVVLLDKDEKQGFPTQLELPL